MASVIITPTSGSNVRDVQSYTSTECCADCAKSEKKKGKGRCSKCSRFK